MVFEVGYSGLPYFVKLRPECRYKGQESTPAGDVGGYAEGWYDAAAAASKQYSRTQENGNDWYDGANGSGNATPSGGGWYEGPSKSGNAKQSSNEWYTGPADGGSPGLSYL